MSLDSQTAFSEIRELRERFEKQKILAAQEDRAVEIKWCGESCKTLQQVLKFVQDYTYSSFFYNFPVYLFQL